MRKAGEAAPATGKDRWHPGSLTKAMTATLLATYVGDAKLHWNDTPEKMIPDSCQDAHPDVRRISVLQLLQHRSRRPGYLLSW